MPSPNKECCVGRVPLSIPPSGARPAATAANQVEYFRQLAGSGALFAWGEAFDQPWKTQEPPWGLHTAAGLRKRVITELASLYRDPR